MFYARSTKQGLVTLSSTEAEICAAVEAVKDVIWFYNILAEIGFPQEGPTTIVHVDNARMLRKSQESETFWLSKWLSK